MRIDKKISWGMFFVFVIFLMVVVSSAGNSISNPQLLSPGVNSFTSLGKQNINPFPVFNEDFCSAGQDFVLQVAPFGCEPSVVRSDLLEEQNVPVFCKIAATKVNPLIDVEAIDSMTFSGRYPQEISGVGFHPAKAAVKSSRTTLLNSATLENIGYAVIVLRQQPNESAMPEFVEGNLTARIRYDIENAFGVGQALYYLPLLENNKWESNYEQYGFWNGKGFLRVDTVDYDSAVVSVYLDKENKLSSFNLEKGQTSGLIYLPGFYCRAGLRLKLNGLEDPDTRAKIMVNGEIVEVGVREKFLDNKCQVRDIDKNGLNQEVEISCKTDEGGKRFDLILAPRVKLEIDINGGKEIKELGAGEKIYEIDEGKKSVYLGYIGETSEGDKFIIPVVSPAKTPKEFQNTQIYKSLPSVVNVAKSSSGNVLLDVVLGYIIGGYGIEALATNFLVTGSYPVGWIYEEGSNEKSKGLEKYENPSGIIEPVWNTAYDWAIKGGVLGTIVGNDIRFVSFAGAVDSSLDDAIKEDYDGAMADYRAIIDSFPEEIKSSKPNEMTFGEASLIQSIELASLSNQKRTMFDLCQEFEERYPDSRNANDYCKNRLKFSSQESSEKGIVINGRTKVLSLDGIYEPSLEEYSARVLIKKSNGELKDVTLRKNQIFNLGEARETLYIIDAGLLISDIYFKYSGGEWLWSPDKENWMGALDIVAKGGEYDKQTLKETTQVLAKLINGKNFAAGKEIITDHDDYDKEEITTSSNEFIQLIELDENSARLKVNLKPSSTFSKGLGQQFIVGSETLEENLPDAFGSEHVFTLTEVNLEKVAKVSVLPNIRYAGTEANISFKIGIEKRGIELSPDKIKKKIENLNESIEKWGETSDRLGKVVKGFNGACLATGAMLTAKNYFQNLDGKSIARQQVMRSDGGWSDICQGHISSGTVEDSSHSNYVSLDDCYIENTNKIDRDVEVVHNTIKNQKAITSENVGQRLNQIKSNMIGGCEVNVCAAMTQQGYDDGEITLSQAKDIERLTAVSRSEDISPQMRETSMNKLNAILEEIRDNSDLYDAKTNLASTFKISPSKIGFLEVGEDVNKKPYNGLKYSDIKFNSPNLAFEDDDPVEILQTNNGIYIVGLDDSAGTKSLTIKKNDENYFLVYSGNGSLVSEDDLPNEFKGSIYFQKYDRTSYENKFINPEVSYFETDPYKGLPATVPFNTEDGWYVAMRQTLPGFGKIRSYDDSGQVASFYLCNVGKNGKPQFNSGTGDDICRMFNPGVMQIYGEFPGLDKSKTSRLVTSAMDAVSDASGGYSSGVGHVTILGKRIKVGKPAVGVPEFQCQDFMSPKDCLLMFNVCDPVVCPSSRCNLGGNYHVSDVVQSGIIGSTFLCLPNAKEKIVAPVCLSGIKAGMDGLVSVQENYRNCLQENLETGRTIGICDEIHSVYLCDFFWNQAAPLAEIAIPKIFEKIKGQGGTRGGGEYLGVQDAWQNAQNSMSFFSNSYAKNSFDAFKLRSVGSVGGAICNNFVSASYPTSIDILEPESPPQYTAWFEERTFTTATIPPTAQYKVFYHIFAGENIGAYYSVYLRAPEGTSFYQTNPMLTVETGFINKGDFASETKDFTAPAGYKELCVRVNEQEECGFGRVTTSFALDYVQDNYLNEQASQTDIKSESECVSGTSSAYSLINPNVQAGLSDVVDPQLYNQGIVRICSTDLPGKSTDPGRWKQVGTCDETGKIKCYIDTNSVQDVIKSVSIEEETLEELEDNFRQILVEEGGYLQDPEFQREVQKIEELGPRERTGYIDDDLFSKILENLKKAKLLLLRGDAYKDLVTAWMERDVEDDDSSGDDNTGNGDGGIVNDGNGETIIVQDDGTNVVVKKIVVDINEIDGKCRDYYSIIREQSSSDEEALFYLAILKQESSCNVLAKKGNSYGLMGIEEPTFNDICEPGIEGVNVFSDILGSTDDKPEKHIECGIMIYKAKLKEYGEGVYESNTYRDNSEFRGNVDKCIVEQSKYKGYVGRKAALRGYNGWGCAGDAPDYVDDVMGKFNILTTKLTIDSSEESSSERLEISENEFIEKRDLLEQVLEYQYSEGNTKDNRLTEEGISPKEWADAVIRNMIEAGLPLTKYNIAFIARSIEAESNFRIAPKKDLDAIFQRKIEELKKNKENQEAFVYEQFYDNNKNEISKITTEKEFDEFIDNHIFSLFLNKFRPQTIGSMQLNIDKAIEIAEKSEDSYTEDYTEKEMRAVLYTLNGGIFYGTLYSKEILEIYFDDLNTEYDSDILQFAFADYHTGLFSSRNAALQKQLNKLMGTSLDLDGDIGPKTLEVIEAFVDEEHVSRNLDKDAVFDEDIILEASSSKEIEELEVYDLIKERYMGRYGKPEYAIVPDVATDSYQWTISTTAETYAGKSQERYDLYCSNNWLDC